MHVVLNFPAPDVIWSTNQDRNFHPQERAKIIAHWKEAAFYHYRSYVAHNAISAALGPTLVSLTIPVSTRARRDGMNYCGTVLKAIVDGLVLAKAWPDDTPDWVDHRQPHFLLGKEVIVKLEPM